MGNKRTPLYDVYEEYNGKIIDYSGWDLPVQFEGIIPEHMAVRQAAGLFDVSHMGEVTVNGTEAEAFLQYLVTNDVAKMANNDVLYTFMDYEWGGVVDDLLIYKYHTERYLLVINAGNIDKDVAWIEKHAQKYQVDVANISPDVAELAIQGPVAQEILQQVTEQPLSEIGFFQFKDPVQVAGVNCIVSRTGYTGEDGFEIYMANADAIAVWRALMAVGEPLGLKPAGLGSRDTLRFEATLPLYGQELSPDITPLEAGFGYFVKLDKDDFLGKAALVEQKRVGLKRRIVGFELVGKGIARHGASVVNEDGKEIGFVTTGYKSPFLNRTIGLAMVDMKYRKLGTPIWIKVRSRVIEAKVVSKKFYSKNYKK